MKAFAKLAWLPIAVLFVSSSALAQQEESKTDGEWRVHVEGRIVRVCPGSGCWIEITDGTRTLIVKSLDHGLLFPKDAAGKFAEIRGIVRVNPPQECKGHGDEAPKDHECPKPTVLVEVKSAKLFAAEPIWQQGEADDEFQSVAVCKILACCKKEKCDGDCEGKAGKEKSSGSCCDKKEAPEHKHE